MKVKEKISSTDYYVLRDKIIYFLDIISDEEFVFFDEQFPKILNQFGIEIEWL